MKKLISIILTMSLVLGAGIGGITAFAAEEETADGVVKASIEFSDLKDSVFSDAVSELVSKGIINGYEDGTFKPKNTITRAEACVMIAKAMNPGETKLNAAPENKFTDMSSGYSWAEKYINYANAVDAVNGYPDNTFGPGKTVTYNELAAMILKGTGVEASDLDGSWPDNFKNAALEKGLYDKIHKTITTQEVESFNYDSPAKRGNAAFMIVAELVALEEAGKAGLPVSDSAGDTVSGNGPVYEDGRYEWIGGEAVQLSLEKAVDIMKNEGYLAEIAKLNKNQDEAIAKGYSDSAKNMNDALKMLDVPEITIAQITAAQAQGVTDGNLWVLQIQRDYAKENIEANNKAELNSIESQTVSIYYGLLQAEENLRVAEENLKVQQLTLKNVKAKASVGSATQLEVTSQESAVNQAEDQIKTAKSTWEEARMSFNLMLGYDITANVELTDKLEIEDMPDMTVDEAVKAATENRLDTVKLKYAYALQEKALKYMKMMTSQKSGEFKKASVQFDTTKTALDNMPKTLELEIRNKYIDLNKKHDAIVAAKETLALAEKSLKTTETLYSVGMSTLAEVQKAQMSIYQTRQLIMASTAEYNIGIYDLKFATDVGIERITL